MTVHAFKENNKRRARAKGADADTVTFDFAVRNGYTLELEHGYVLTGTSTLFSQDRFKIQTSYADQGLTLLVNIKRCVGRDTDGACDKYRQIAISRLNLDWSALPQNVTHHVLEVKLTSLSTLLISVPRPLTAVVPSSQGDTNVTSPHRPRG